MNPVCGASITISGPTGSVQAVVGDRCGACGNDGRFDLDIPAGLFNAVGGQPFVNDGRGPVYWSFASAPSCGGSQPAAISQPAPPSSPEGPASSPGDSQSSTEAPSHASPQTAGQSTKYDNVLAVPAQEQSTQPAGQSAKLELDVPAQQPTQPAGQCGQVGTQVCVGPGFKTCTASGSFVSFACPMGTTCQQSGETVTCIHA